MKKKTICIFVCMLMIATAVPVMGTTTEIIKKETNSNLLKNEDFIKKNVYPLHDPEVEWSNVYGGENHDVFRNVKQTTDEGFITVGVCNTTCHGLFKFDADGNQEWVATAMPNETLWPRCYIVEQTDDGGYITAGCHEDNLGFGYNRCVWKVDEDGNTEWCKIYDNPLYGYHMCIQPTTDGGYIVAGEADVAPGDWDVLLLKIDSSGDIEWQQIHKYGTLGDCAYAVRQTDDGGYILSGRKELGGVNSELLVIKTDSDGNIEWDQTYGGIWWEWSQSNDILIAEDGYYILAETDSYGAGSRDVWLVKIDNDGNEKWNKTYGGKYWEMSGGMCYTHDEKNILLCATYDTNGMMPPKSEGFVVKINLNGDIIWQNTFGHDDVDQLQGIYALGDGSCVAAGLSDMPGSSGVHMDGWLIKIKAFENNPPDKPKGKGETKIDPGKTYTFKVKTNDVDGDQIYYQWDWGTGDDESKSEWLGPYESGEECETDNYWDEGGKYEIKVRAKDEHGAESEWVNPKVKSNSYYKIFDLNFNLVNWLIVRLSRYFPGILNRI